ncbi:hypothetical protein A3A60_00635 [Candidatus Curtissbacteria bacterium RIFCSPLOWO2_01_FULL_42_26]|uniref:Cohesin domain-containing protein n=1 Tax=Candidatus Curtissbacteria bacterium RIFCSPLOWO2_01_FULL_42_26 TaxID=1797729 RepID=A0A1F5HX45_9BACT|nr:MAG: hypothetical protein A3A60_00635 [Candidatus Curtissbacteria bacterium RIFCSPLOWO2_01_FULL_42_26]
MQGLRFLKLLPEKSSLRGLLHFGLLGKIAAFCTTLIFTTFSPLSLGTVFAQTTTTKVYLAGAQSTSIVGIVGGHTMPVSVKVDNITNTTGLAAFSFKIGYNPNLVSIPDSDNNYIADTGTVKVGPFLGSSGKQVRCGDGFIDKDLADSTKKYLTFTCGTLGATPAAPKGSGVLATINFKTGNTVGFDQLSLVISQLADNTAMANLISATTANINVGVAKCANLTGNDNQVLIEDILYVIQKYYTNYPPADLNGDGIVLVDDIVLAVDEYYQIC